MSTHPTSNTGGGTTAPGPLAQLRLVVVAFAGAIVSIGVVVLILATTAELGAVEAGPLQASLPPLAVGVVALASLRRLPPSLSCESPAALFGTYRTRLMIRMAVSEMAGLIGFMAFILTGEPLAFAVGAALSLVGFAVIYPSSANLARDQDALTSQGCAHSLEAVLMGQA